ncbi:MAG: P-loop NTPase, partial [Candidatus Methylomirabilales bacterium]
MDLPGIEHVVAFASGKGGVGRSTVLANLAAALVEKGFKVGLLDADLEDPGLLHLMGVQGEPERQGEKVLPFEEYGFRALSLAFLLKGEASDSEDGLEASLIEEGLK